MIRFMLKIPFITFEQTFNLYSRKEIASIKESFWIAFGRYISLHLNSEGEKTNWINYKTGYKDLYFRMEADQKKASISIQITHGDKEKQKLFFERLESLKRIFEETMNEKWNWELDSEDEYGKPVAKIGITLKDVNVLQQERWPEIISFLKPRMIKLDEFWNNVKDLFEELRYI